MNLTVPELSLVALVGVTGSGKSTFAAQHFRPGEVISSDACRAMVANDENDQSATGDAFDVLQYIASKRLTRGLLTVVDATNVQREARAPLVELARAYHVLPVAIVFDLDLSVCLARNTGPGGRNLPVRVVQRQREQLRRSARSLKREGFRYVHLLTSEDEVARACIERTRSWTDRSEDAGPFDIVGDVHGCFDELVALLQELGYHVRLEADVGEDGGVRHHAAHPDGRRVVFLGDLVDRGPATPDVLKLAMGMAAQGDALVVPGNHEDKLKRALMGREVRVSHGLEESLEQLAAEPPGFREEVVSFIDGLVSHLVLDGRRLVVAHAGMREELAGRASRKVRDFALYGETTGETDEFGLPVRYQWAADYRGQAAVVFGHTPVPRAEWLNNTICIDTGCVFGGSLTALRWPERDLVSVPARRTYYAPIRPMQLPASEPRSLQHQHEDLLDLADVTGKRQIETAEMGRVTIRSPQAAAALETVSRFAVDPRWLIHLPPTMAPAGTMSDGEHLEHPEAAWAFFRADGISKLVCEEKHMGSRAIAVLVRDADAAGRRFGATDGRLGIVTTRTGRPFFDPSLERDVLDRLRGAATAAMLWEELETDWLCLDAEVMPWSLKADELVRDHFATVGAAGRAVLARTQAAFSAISDRVPELDGPLERVRERRQAVEQFADAYRPYCWPVDGIDEVRIAPFHLLASAGGVHHQREHTWHLDVLGRLVDADLELLQRTTVRQVELDDEGSVEAATNWWKELTAAGGEGMVVKPLGFTVRGRRGLVQPAIKVRGREYLRIIYGPEYTLHLDRLRDRSLRRKRANALREYALGIEALERFVAGRPLRDVHEAVFGVLALESEPIDPRL